MHSSQKITLCCDGMKLRRYEDVIPSALISRVPSGLANCLMNSVLPMPLGPLMTNNFFDDAPFSFACLLFVELLSKFPQRSVSRRQLCQAGEEPAAPILVGRSAPAGIGLAMRDRAKVNPRPHCWDLEFDDALGRTQPSSQGDRLMRLG